MKNHLCLLGWQPIGEKAAAFTLCGRLLFARHKSHVILDQDSDDVTCKTCISVYQSYYRKVLAERQKRIREYMQEFLKDREAQRAAWDAHLKEATYD